ncbi:Lrp/AsnC ligand binding domain-containing protein [Streptomyces sp. MS1.AVA.1]|uniref:Lrp/AsnC ligand binding domain-containing protein n=1 Tax=Streptomyces machairae TaxID=3134109 RepID=A0ABU8UIB9_9ACTN
MRARTDRRHGGTRTRHRGRGALRPGQARVVATALARRPECVFAHVLTGSWDCLAEVQCPRDRLAGLVMDELLPGLPGAPREYRRPRVGRLLPRPTVSANSRAPTGCW